MGGARYDHVDWDAHTSRSYAGKADHEVFTSRILHPDLDPSKFKKREAVASEANPHPTPIIIACDETGSMGALAGIIIRKGLGTIMNALYERRPVSDPQILMGGIGDAECDQAPIQATQFEADGVNLSKQIENIYIEGNGGGNSGESYPLAWFLAAYKTKCDAIRKEGRKGYLFTIGDEQPLPILHKASIKRFFGMDAQADMDIRVLLADTQKDWNVFHLIVKPVSSQPVIATWQGLLGARAVVVEDYNRLAEGIVACIEVCEGRNAADIVKGWDHDSAVIVRDVTRQLVPRLTAGA